MTEVVKVLIRERITSNSDQGSAIRHCDLVKNRIFVEDRPFTVGKVFRSTATQEDVYASIEPLVQKFLQGYSCNVMAYGQSGTGKSFTMGLQSDNFENSSCGIVPRALREIMEFTSIPDNETTVEISFFEIYNEKVFDLLSDKTDEHINTKGSKFTGGVKRPLRSLFDAELVLIEGNKNRRTRPTAMNTNSSRSHGIVVIYRKTKDSSSTFHMVDLAGSEGVRRTGHKGEALAEGSHINRGLLGIGNIFKALSDGSCRVPYRDTVLGSVLQDSLNLNGFSTLVICISAMRNDVSETINSLTFAQRVMNMKINPKIQYTVPDSKKKPKKDESFSILNQENFETPIAMKRPLASSTAQRSKFRPNLHKITELQAPIALTSRPINPQLLDLQNSQLMESPTVKQCFDAMKRTLQKRNIRINSINFSEIEGTLTSDSDSGELNSTVIQRLPMEAEEVKDPVTNSSVPLPQLSHQERDSAIFDIDEVSHIQHNSDEDDAGSIGSPVTDQRMSFDFKVPEVPLARISTYKRLSHRPQQSEQESTVPTDRRRSIRLQQDVEQPHIDSYSTDRRRSVRIQQSEEQPDIDTISTDRRRSVRVRENVEQSVIDTVPTDRRRSVRILQNAEKRKSIAPQLPSPPAPKRRRTTISKKARRESNIGEIVSKADHCKNVLNLLNKGDMKGIQVLPQIGMKTAYCIITHRSLNGKFKSFEEVAAAPFWRGKGWERFEKANNLC
ncbi:kinesin-like protein Nod isoform X2 [Bradysia coprophila]|uniref:kinesin-like protein Nod isoform X2 n=1 Tax=Bradysia coprophila TaxID=38358 RepID=UPI00187DD631|nr:kinesin-like protein Nod isoform X2 [Bradysia coprophila]